MAANSVLDVALRDLAGTERVLVYDVPAAERPVRTGPASPFVMGGGAWWRFVRRRRVLDDGWLTILVALRCLPEDEALLAVDWGTRFANALLLVEPNKQVDLTLANGVESSFADSQLRAVYGVWRFWQLRAGRREPHCESLDLAAAVSIVETFRERLPRVFPPEAFQAALLDLNSREADLFVGKPVERVILPFLTRLGLPIPYDPAILLNATRDLINRGQAWVEDASDGRLAYHGPERPLPDDMSDERLARMTRI